MKKLYFVISVILAAVLIFGCAKNEPTTSSETAQTQKTAEETDTAETESESGIPEEPETLFAGDFGEPHPAEQAVEEGEYFLVDDIEEGFVEIYDGMVFFDAAENDLLEIGGILQPSENEGVYYRLDYSARESYSDFNAAFAGNTAGVTIRFRTDADYFAIDMKLYGVPDHYLHFADRGAYGIDVYTGTGTMRSYCGGLMQFMTDDDELYDVIELPGGFQEVEIELPQYAGVDFFQIGLPEGSQLAAPIARTHGPILFYGSSITQGATTGRPGNAYTNILCRMLDCDCINLGFSGSDLGEQEIAQYIITRDFDIFVMDYNNNADFETLEATHYDFYKTVRDAKPDVPIVILSKPYFTDEPGEVETVKEKIILETVRKAQEEGDENVYFISADDYFPKEQRNLYTIDMVHPNDMGHYFMAKTIFPQLYTLLNK